MKYFTELHLSGYKSIKDVTVKLHPGINIFIGPNGSGKSNLLTFVSFFRSEIPDLEFEYSSDVSWCSGKELFRKILKQKIWIDLNVELNEDDVINFRKQVVEYSFFHGGEKVVEGEFTQNNLGDIFDKMENYEEHRLNLIHYLKFFDSNKEYEFLSYPTNISLAIPEILRVFNINIPFSSRIAAVLFFLNKSKKVPKELQPDFINGFDVRMKSVLVFIKKHSPVLDIRLRDSLSIGVDISNNIVVENIQLQFKLKDGWFNWNDLSDGTKRILIIIDFVLNNSNVLLIEEPELGIHPHQLSRLLEFLKEQSKEKQILISTHSPEVLDVLGMNELDHINLVSIKSGSTQVKKLTAKQKKKAKDYFEVSGSLGDYWKHSDLEV